VHKEKGDGVTNYVGLVVLTAYCSCFSCCKPFADGITASGTKPAQGRTVAANWLPFGTRVYLDGVGWRTVEDRMAKRFSERVDVYFDRHADARRFGIRTNRVWVVRKDKR
jgi:3D (Asp-Asp-Asp) domain-containing protein